MVNIKQIFGTGNNKTNKRATICAAVNSKQLIEFHYHGGFRAVEPFCLGVVMPSKQVNNEVLLCYQVSGHDEFGEPAGWKLFRLSEISDLKMIKENFAVSSRGYNPNNVTMTSVYCCVIAADEGESKPQKEIRLVASKETEVRSHYDHTIRVAPPLTHNERMRRFRFSHPSLLSKVTERVRGIGCAIMRKKWFDQS